MHVNMIIGVHTAKIEVTGMLQIYLAGFILYSSSLFRIIWNDLIPELSHAGET